MNLEEIKRDSRLEELTAEDWQVFLAFYDRRQQEASGGRDDDATELEIARDLRQAAYGDGLAPEPDGSVSRLRPGGLDWADPETLRAAQAVTAGGKRSARGRSPDRMTDVLQGVGMLLAVAVGLVWWLWPEGGTTDQVQANETAMAGTVEVTPTALPTLEAELLADIVDAAGVKTGLVAPRTLEIKGVSFVVQPVKISAGDWPLPDDERAVSWVFGTVVNYVLGLEATSDNKALLAALVPGDELLLRMSTGPAYRFAYVDAVRVAPQASEIFRQTRPGLTLTLLAESQQSTRIVLRARYLPDSDLGNTGTMAAASISPGQPIDLGSIRLTVREHRPVVQADTPPGHVYVAITYEARNIDESLPLLPGAFTQRLEAGGLTWPLAPGTKQTTANLRPGEALTTTVTYIVPEPALAEPLRWTFAPDPAGPTGQMDLAPFADQLEPEVAITEATRQADRLTLQLHIKTALRAVRLTANDLMVEGAQLDTINYFPWQVAPGTEGKFTLVLQPQQELVRLGLLGQGFEVTD